MESIKGKNILIIGATGGVGSGTAKLLSAAGATLFITGRNKEKLQAIGNDLSIPATRQFIVDICSETNITRAVDDMHRQIAAVDIAIIASGIGIIKTMDALSAEEFIRTLHTNLVGPFLLIKAILPNMKEQKKGLIINIPGVLGKVPMAGAAAYSASKYGLTGMMQSIREEIKRTEIRITNLFLGGVDSPFWDGIDLRVQREKMINASEAAKAIWFLCQQPRSGVISEMVLQPFNHQAI
ncbi:MAG: SDR family oxidoreductase [Bacteroidota bacterium]